MHAHDFCYWLQGLFELGEPSQLTEKQTQTIKAHLDMVFVHEIDSKYGNKVVQDKLNILHNQNLCVNDLSKVVPHGDPLARC